MGAEMKPPERIRVHMQGIWVICRNEKPHEEDFGYIRISEHEKILKEMLNKAISKTGEGVATRISLFAKEKYEKQLAEKDEKIKYLTDKLKYEYDEAMDELQSKDDILENLKVKFANDEAKWIHAVAERNKTIEALIIQQKHIEKLNKQLEEKNNEIEEKKCNHGLVGALIKKNKERSRR
jgi:septal ring factor EnvC (AmiA/AmiB activator)